MTQCLILLIPKPQKDKPLLDNWRPIALLQNDFKMFAGLIATKMKNTLEEVVDETQSGFIPGRHINNKIRLILLGYSDLIEGDGLILFLDFF